MFGLEYVLALISVLFKVGFAIVISIPFRIAWNCIAPIYISFLPELYLNIPYWHFVGIILVINFIGDLIQNLTPSIIKIDNSNKKDIGK